MKNHSGITNRSSGISRYEYLQYKNTIAAVVVVKAKPNIKLVRKGVLFFSRLMSVLPIRSLGIGSVSYTHLALPTILLV